MEKLIVLATGNGWVAVDKPAGIGVEKHFNYDTVEKRALSQFQRLGATKLPYVGIVHRLDRPVSGVLLLAKNKSTLVTLNKLFADRKVNKTYLALVDQPPPTPQGKLRHFLLRDKYGKKAIAATRPLPGAKESILEYKLVTEYATGIYLLRIKPLTGKFHQIRVQLATIGCPIIGDGLYGAMRPFDQNKIALHAHQLSFQLPATQKTSVLEAPLPESWQAFMAENS